MDHSGSVGRRDGYPPFARSDSTTSLDLPSSHHDSISPPPPPPGNPPSSDRDSASPSSTPPGIAPSSYHESSPSNHNPPSSQPDSSRSPSPQRGRRQSSSLPRTTWDFPSPDPELITAYNQGWDDRGRRSPMYRPEEPARNRRDDRFRMRYEDASRAVGRGYGGSRYGRAPPVPPYHDRYEENRGRGRFRFKREDSRYGYRSRERSAFREKRSYGGYGGYRSDRDVFAGLRDKSRSPSRFDRPSRYSEYRNRSPSPSHRAWTDRALLRGEIYGPVAYSASHTNRFEENLGCGARTIDPPQPRGYYPGNEYLHVESPPSRRRVPRPSRGFDRDARSVEQPCEPYRPYQTLYPASDLQYGEPHQQYLRPSMPLVAPIPNSSLQRHGIAEVSRFVPRPQTGGIYGSDVRGGAVGQEVAGSPIRVVGEGVPAGPHGNMYVRGFWGMFEPFDEASHALERENEELRRYIEANQRNGPRLNSDDSPENAINLDEDEEEGEVPVRRRPSLDSDDDDDGSDHGALEADRADGAFFEDSEDDDGEGNAAEDNPHGIRCRSSDLETSAWYGPDRSWELHQKLPIPVQLTRVTPKECDDNCIVCQDKLGGADCSEPVVYKTSDCKCRLVVGLSCLRRWFAVNDKCPVCRRDLY